MERSESLWFGELLDAIQGGGTRYTTEVRYSEINQDLAEFRQAWPGPAADFLQVQLETTFGRLSVPEAVKRLSDIADNLEAPDEIRTHALVSLAWFTSATEPAAVNDEYRTRALELAVAQGALGWALVILVNHMAVSAQRGDYAPIQALAEEKERLVSRMPRDVLARPANQEAMSRAMTHEAKATLHLADPSSPESFELAIQDAIGKYQQAIEREIADDERRFNFMVELAQELTLLSARTEYTAPLESASAVLDAALPSLNAHACYRCRGYYEYVRAQWYACAAHARLETSAPEVPGLLHRAVGHAERSAKELAPMQHPLGDVARELQEDLQREAILAARPKRVFLSHAGADKPLVRRVHRALSVVGYEPWLDDEDMVAGTRLFGGIKAGLAASCAAVFFVTDEFEDDRYIRQEVDWALEQKISRGDEFAIITLLFPGASTERIPEVLRTYVWKEPEFEVDALTELIRALPVRPGTPHWPISST